ncbi:D-alanyl-D-alanine carboxypeptidase [Rhizobium setariae]|uniref:D-alanyl-D-alanine carboxypeptidase n=1 Tax=Rhizobium setariae TaxID=2801340 RepID=UPI0031BAC64B
MQAYAGPRPASIVIDVRTGEVMQSEDPDGLRYPASLTKMMTLYMVFDALESGRISLSSRVPVSKFAASQSPSKLGVRAGTTFTVEQGILALVTRSANDCATAFAEFLGGSEPRFGKMMTAKARTLGMNRTVYHNANGLPDARQVTTARDQARLGIALRKHYPQYYSYFSARSFKYGKQVIGNHNRLLGAVRGVDGIKTGFTRAAGFNLVTSAQVDGRSVVGVVMGGTSGRSRDAKMRKLIETYLPQAARRGGKADAMVSMKPKREMVETAYAEPERQSEALNVVAATNDLDLPHKGPMPEARYEASEQLTSAETTNSVPLIRTKTVKVTKVAALQAMPTENIPAAEPEESTRSISKVDTVTTASTTSKGWVIQVGTASGNEQAQVILQKVQDKGGKVLRSATPFTVAFAKGNEQLYRARFGGFADQDAAVSACKVLKKKGVSCWASLQ